MHSVPFENAKWSAVLNAYLGAYYREKKNFIRALHYYNIACEVLEEINDLYNLAIIYKGISFIYEQQKQYEKALLYSHKSQEATFEFRTNTIAIETYQKYIQTYLETQQNKLIIAEQTIQLKNRQVAIIIIISAFTLIVILLILLYTHQQKLRKASENRELSAKLEHEKRVQYYEKRQRRLEKEKHEAIVDAQTREITTYSMLVSNKNQMLKQIQELTVQLSDNKENITKSTKKIEEIVQSNLNIDEEWDNFKMHFHKVHPLFFEKLKQHCDDLTEENLKMCAYIKMRMTTKQIAQLLNVIPSSIITSRYRLKKKLQLTDEVELDGFIGDL
jgi:tetratricopeptide (TPR) repeat protein